MHRLDSGWWRQKLGHSRMWYQIHYSSEYILSKKFTQNLPLLAGFSTTTIIIQWFIKRCKIVTARVLAGVWWGQTCALLVRRQTKHASFQPSRFEDRQSRCWWRVKVWWAELAESKNASFAISSIRPVLGALFWPPVSVKTFPNVDKECVISRSRVVSMGISYSSRCCWQPIIEDHITARGRWIVRQLKEVC